MAARSGPSTGLQGRAPAILATLLAIGLLYLIVRTALASLSPVAAAQLPPGEYSRILRLGLNELLLPGRRVSPDLAALARHTAHAQPLAFEPFFVAARAAEDKGQFGEAIRLMEEARRRRRNFVPTRLQLAAYYGRSGQLAGALRELELLLSLRPNAVGPLMVELTKLMATPEGRSALADALARNPSWRPAFFTTARAQAVTPDQAYAFLQEVRARRPNGDLGLERRLFMTTLLNSGQIGRARDIWLQTLPESERSRYRLMANPGFAGRPVDPPFGWSLGAVDVGRAEIRDANTPRPHLFVEYFGGSSAILAEQLLALAPGRYRLRFEATGEGESGLSDISWTLVCRSGSPQLLGADMTGSGTAFRRKEIAFAVPASGCEAQQLRLIAEAGDVSSPVNLRIRGLEVVR